MKRKQAVKAILFAVIFLFLLQSLTYVLRTNGDIKEIFLGFYAEPKDTIDVIMIGSSPVYPFYAAPKLWGEYGFTMYPLSSNVQRPKAAVYLVEEALKTQSPELFVFELRMYTYEEGAMADNMAYTRGVTDNLKYSWNRIRLINSLVSDVSERYTYYFDIFKYHSNWKTLILPDQYTAFRYERLHPLKGYAMHDEVWPGAGADYSGVTEQVAIPAEQEENLRALLAYLQEKDLNALFIVSPMVLDENMQKKFNYMEGIITSYGYDYLNFNNHYDELGIDFATDYYDGGSHVNASGSEKCTAFLGDYLTEHYALADRRGDKKYSTWDAAYVYWQECQEEALETINNKVLNGEYDVVSEEE
ncbi:MAG: SGNH/GDSL hydrolase family protein [Lachnospiraceae bacterium]|nr:SGNH/GDSL hydrolase family protein [Lachnospiraceae bacterium]